MIWTVDINCKSFASKTGGLAATCRPAWCGNVLCRHGDPAPPPLRTKSRSRSVSAWRRPVRSAANGKQALLGMKIWEEETNAKGGLLGRPVKLIYYDDQSNPSTVPGIYTKLLDVDKVDLIVGGYATNMVAPAMPVVMQRERRSSACWPRCEPRFQISTVLRHDPTGPGDQDLLHRGLLRGRGSSKIRSRRLWRWRPRTPNSRKNACDGARENAKKSGLKVVYDKSYPPATTDFAPIVRAIQATNPDIVWSAPIRSIRSEWCRRSTRWASSRR